MQHAGGARVDDSFVFYTLVWPLQLEINRHKPQADSVGRCQAEKDTFTIYICIYTNKYQWTQTHGPRVICLLSAISCEFVLYSISSCVPAACPEPAACESPSESESTPVLALHTGSPPKSRRSGSSRSLKASSTLASQGTSPRGRARRVRRSKWCSYSSLLRPLACSTPRLLHSF